jgi:predicted TIM-barrel fold metal-dependent hydrolase
LLIVELFEPLFALYESTAENSMRIDFHTHFQCLDFVKHLHSRSALPRSVRDGGTYIVQCGAGLNVPSMPKMIDMDEKLRDMERMQIDCATLSHGLPFGSEVLGSREADEWASRINDDLARIISTYPGKFIGLGSIGFGDPARSIAEVNRCIRQLGFCGFQVFSNVADRSLDSGDVIPVLKHIASLGAPIHLHPAVPLNRVGIERPSLSISLGFPYDSSLNTVRLIQSGLFDEAPELKLVVSHTGGVLPYLSGRIAAYTALSHCFGESSCLSHPVGHYLSRLYVDTVCYGIEALECCYKVMGADHMLFGTDHPFGPYDLAAEVVERLDCTASEREAIYHGNAEQLLRLQTMSAVAC